MLGATGFTLTDDIRAVVGNMFSGVLETEVLEQMFQRDRKAESFEGSFARKLRPEQGWDNSITKSVESEVFNFHAPNWTQEPCPRGVASRDIKGMFEVRSSENSVNMRNVMSDKATPPWGSLAVSLR